MPVLAPERPMTLVESWLEFDTVDAGPAGPLFVGGRHAESEITMTGGGAGCGTSYNSGGMTGCTWCSGSYCGPCY